MTLYLRDEVIEAISDKSPRLAPTVLCFNENTTETTKFLQVVRKRLLAGGVKSASWMSLPDREDYRHISSYMDFTPIQYIGTSAALVLAAEYERAATIAKSSPPAVNLHDWSDDVVMRLLQLGFFPLLGLVESNLPPLVSMEENEMTLRFLSGSDAGETRHADSMLMELANFIDPDKQLSDAISIPLTSALSEAMVNVRMHAYPDDYRFQNRHINRWWLTGSANRKSRKLTVAIFDQGASIPVTYAKRTMVQGLLDGVWKMGPVKSHPFRNDGAQIDAAITYGKSQSDLPQRGKGLPQMREAIDACGKGRLMIFSRGGMYVYQGGGRSEHQSLRASVGGTLIEWEIELPEIDHD